MEHIQNATLAGGVIVGAVADMHLSPFGAIVAGSLAGIVGTLGFVHVQPYLAEKLKIIDTCGEEINKYLCDIAKNISSVIKNIFILTFLPQVLTTCTGCRLCWAGCCPC